MVRSPDPKRLALWQGRFQRFLDSGLAVARFCAVERVSVSSFYYWQKKLGPQTLRSSACADGREVFRPVTVVPAVCGVLFRLPGGTRIEVGAEHLEALRVVVAEAMRIDRGWEADRRSSCACEAVGEHVGAASC